MLHKIARYASILIAMLMPVSAMAAPSSSARIVMTGIVPTLCTASFTQAPSVSGGNIVNLGQLTRRCNQGEGYRIVLHSRSGLKGATFVVGGRAIPLSDSGVTLLLDADEPGQASETAFIRFSGAVPADALELRIETIAKGEIF